MQQVGDVELSRNTSSLAKWAEHVSHVFDEHVSLFLIKAALLFTEIVFVEFLSIRVKFHFTSEENMCLFIT